jgi:hypothetical protein
MRRNVELKKKVMVTTKKNWERDSNRFYLENGDDGKQICDMIATHDIDSPKVTSNSRKQ